jgi:lipopolysaccharide/colanic/teichoic acid biosynthesis glycosyltransferase
LLKRCLDIIIATTGLAVVFVPGLLVACIIKLTSPGPVFFRQERMGRGSRPFWIYKFRSMVQDAPSRGKLVTAGADPRITPVGRFLRAAKIDELPQLINVLVGDMSLVGPRPEVRKYVEMFQADYQDILRVRPGITDPASIKFRNEAEILGQANDPEKVYIEQILPEKIRLAREYVENPSICLDLMIILKTFHVVGWRRANTVAQSPASTVNSHD